MANRWPVEKHNQFIDDLQVERTPNWHQDWMRTCQSSLTTKHMIGKFVQVSKAYSSNVTISDYLL